MKSDIRSTGSRPLRGPEDWSERDLAGPPPVGLAAAHRPYGGHAEFPSGKGLPLHAHRRDLHLGRNRIEQIPTRGPRTQGRGVVAEAHDNLIE
jgi:hypothetical protein